MASEHITTLTDNLPVIICIEIEEKTGNYHHGNFLQ